MKEEPTSLAFAVVALTVVLVALIGGMITLIVFNNNRRLRYVNELAEARRLREQEVLRAEREAVQQTLHEVGKELHDNVAQLLSTAQQAINRELQHTKDPVGLTAGRDALDQGVEEVRRLGRDLNSDLWKRRSLVEAISATAESLERVGRLRAHVLVEGEAPVLSSDTSTILFRVFQEVVQNTVKHSGADTLTVTIATWPSFALTIADNGRGFDVERTPGNSGLLNIRKRCALIGYTAQLTSVPERGCTWHFQRTSEA